MMESKTELDMGLFVAQKETKLRNYYQLRCWLEIINQIQIHSGHDHRLHEKIKYGVLLISLISTTSFLGDVGLSGLNTILLSNCTDQFS